MNIAKKLTVLSVIFSMLFLVSCEDDSDDPATSGTLNVTINFTNPEAWPSEGTVFCSMDSTWPPTGAPYKSTTLQSSQVQNGVISLVFEDIEFNTYRLLSVSWRDPNDPNPATNQYIFGVLIVDQCLKMVNLYFMQMLHHLLWMKILLNLV